MKKRNKIFGLSTVAFLGISGLLGITAINRNASVNQLQNIASEDYTLTLNAENAPAASAYAKHTIVKNTGATFETKYVNAKASTSGHIALNAGGELIISSKLNGLHSIKVNFTGNVTAYFGVSDKYDYDCVLSNGVEAELMDGYSFDHIKLVAAEETDIINITFKYSCVTPKIQTLEKHQQVNIDGAVIKGYNSGRILGEYSYAKVVPFGNNTITKVERNSETLTAEANGSYKVKNGPNDRLDVTTSVDGINTITANKFTIDPDTGAAAAAGTETVAMTVSADGKYVTVNAPQMNGYVPNQDYIRFVRDTSKTSVNFYYSQVDKYVAGVTATAPDTGDGSSTNPWLVKSCANWEYIKATVDASDLKSGDVFKSKYFKLTKSLDFDGNDRGFNVSSTDSEMAFAGIFNGNNCSIRNYVGDEGLFGNITSVPTISYLSLYGTVTGKNNKTAAFASHVGNGGKFKYCNNYVNVNSSTAYVGGFVGYGTTKFDYCDNYGTITVTHKTNGANYNGGFVGAIALTAGYFKNCNNFGAVTGKDCLGGIVGANAGAGSAVTIENCNNFGVINATYSTTNVVAGGIMGGNNLTSGTVTITNCTNYGDVTGTTKGYSTSVGSKTGGIFGGTVSAGVAITMTNVKNFGDVRAQAYAGGIFGYYYGNSSAITIDGAINAGDIIQIDTDGYTGCTNLGGIGGYVTGNGTAETASTFKNCVNVGDVTGLSLVAGILASDNAGTAIVNFENCDNYGCISATFAGDTGVAYAGGVIGWVRSHTSNYLKNCNNYGEIYSAKRGGLGGVIAYTGGTTNITLDACANFGYVHGANSLGGLCGATTAATDTTLKFLNCVNNGILDGTDAVGGIIGTIYAETIVFDTTGSTNNGLIVCAGSHYGNIVGLDSRK